MEQLTKDEIIIEIKTLISVDGTSVEINPNYLEYFDLDELIDIKEQLTHKKVEQESVSKEYLDHLYDKLN